MEGIARSVAADRIAEVWAGPTERSTSRSGYRAGYYSRGAITRLGKTELRVPRDRNGEFSTALFERFQRKSVGLGAAEIYVWGCLRAITKELCAHSFSATVTSKINKGLDETLTKFAQLLNNRAGCRHLCRAASSQRPPQRAVAYRVSQRRRRGALL